MDFAPTASWEMLRLRAKLLRQIREFFDRRQFLEVETPLLSADTVADLHLDPIPVTLFDDPRQADHGRRLWLQTSPEFAMKRLLAAGGQRLYQITKAFRGGEVGPLHNPEFTLVEWYRVGDDMRAGMQLLAELAQDLFQVESVDKLSYEEAFLQHLSINPHVASASEMAACASRVGLHPPASLGEDRDQWLNFLLAEVVEPQLGAGGPVILFDYPANQAALARLRSVVGRGDSKGAEISYQVAERFELYFKGVELANGYHELVDADVLRERNRKANAVRAADNRYQVPVESRLLEAMRQGLPACSGVALGFDRLVMVVAGAKQLSEVMAFPIDRC